MKFNISNKEQKEAFINCVKGLLQNASNPLWVEIKKVRANRTLSQNSYLHALLTAYARHFGYTLNEAKQQYKWFSADIYLYEKNGTKFLKSSADLNTKEMVATIDAFKREAAKGGLYLPDATDNDGIANLLNNNEV